MPKKLRIACIYFPINSVGGINTSAQVFKKAAEAVGDTWHVIRCANHKTAWPTLFPEPIAVAGGDTYMTIDGRAGHHEVVLDETVKWLEANYDALFFVHACCHPTKAYGRVPYWAEIYKRVNLPKILRFGDAHYSTYSWIDEVLPLCKQVFVNQPAYAAAIPHIKADHLPMAFLPHPDTGQKRAPFPFNVWTVQAKTVKCYPGFVKVLPKIDTALGIYSSGVYYYTLRTTPEWINGIGVDYFAKGYADLKGPKNHRYYGFVSYDQIQKVYAAAWGSIDLQGYHGGTRKEYSQGSYNNSELDSLWGGCRLIVHRNMLKSPIPSEFILPVDGPEDIPKACAEVTPLNRSEHKRAREWLMETHGAAKTYQKIRRAILR